MEEDKSKFYYWGAIIILSLIVIFSFNLYFTEKGKCDSKVNLLKEYYAQKIDYVATHLTNISSVYNYTSRTINYSQYLAERDKHPCNCSNFRADRFELKLEDPTHFSMSRDVYCGNKTYKEIISFSYLAPLMKNWSEYHPSEFCITVG